MLKRTLIALAATLAASAALAAEEVAHVERLRAAGPTGPARGERPEPAAVGADVG